MPRHPDLARFIDEHAILRGSFTLTSGRQSSYYCDGKQITFAGEGLALLTDAVVEEIRDLDIDAIGGMDMGATPIVSAVALRMFQLGRPIAAFIVRKDAKEHGTRKEIEGILPRDPARILVIDDVITSGGSIIKAIHAVQSQGHEVVLAMSILDRDSGGREALAAIGVKYQPLVTIAELGITNESPS